MKTLWQKENLLVLSNFFFCHNVFKSRLLQRRQEASVLGKGLILLTFYTEEIWRRFSRRLSKTVREKEEILIFFTTSIFKLSNLFYLKNLYIIIVIIFHVKK